VFVCLCVYFVCGCVCVCVSECACVCVCARAHAALVCMRVCSHVRDTEEEQLDVVEVREDAAERWLAD